MSNASDLQSPIKEATTTTFDKDNDMVLSAVGNYSNDENAKKYLTAPVLDDDAHTNQVLPPATFATMHISGGSDNSHSSSDGGDYVFLCSANQQGKHPQQLENEASNSTSTTEGSSDGSNGDGGCVGTAGVHPERGPLTTCGNSNNEDANNIAHPPPAAVFVCDEAQHAVPAATMHLDFSALHAGHIANDQKSERAEQRGVVGSNNGRERSVDDDHSTSLAPLDALFPTVVPVVGTTTMQPDATGFSLSSSQPPQSYFGGQTASRSNDDMFSQQQRGGAIRWKTISVSTCPATPSPRMLSSGKASLAELILDDQHFGSVSQHQLPHMQRQQPPQHPHAHHYHCQQHQQQIYDQQQHSSAVLHPTQTVAVAPPTSLMHKSMMDNGNSGGGGFISTHGGGPNTYEELLRQEEQWQQQSVHRYQAQQQLPHAAAADGPLGAVTDDMSLSSGEGEYHHQNSTKPHSSESSTSCNSDVSDVGSEFSPDDDDDEDTNGGAGGGGQWNFWDHNKKPLGSYMLGN